MTRLISAVLWLAVIAACGLGMGGCNMTAVACQKVCGAAGVRSVSAWSCECNQPAPRDDGGAR